jgi:hypothetical protein
MLKAEVQMAEEKEAEKNPAEWLERPKTANSANVSKNIKKVLIRTKLMIFLEKNKIFEHCSVDPS